MMKRVFIGPKPTLARINKRWVCVSYTGSNAMKGYENLRIIGNGSTPVAAYIQWQVKYNAHMPQEHEVRRIPTTKGLA